MEKINLLETKIRQTIQTMVRELCGSLGQTLTEEECNSRLIKSKIFLADTLSTMDTISTSLSLLPNVSEKREELLMKMYQEQKQKQERHERYIRIQELKTDLFLLFSELIPLFDHSIPHPSYDQLHIRRIWMKLRSISIQCEDALRTLGTIPEFQKQAHCMIL
jgi:hypothetical protein